MDTRSVGGTAHYCAASGFPFFSRDAKPMGVQQGIGPSYSAEDPTTVVLKSKS
jgi:hypothetical protein